MGVIEVKGIRVFAYHGCLAEEERIGGHYRVDVRVSGDFASAMASDALADTIDYGRITAIVAEEMGKRSKLIEHVAARILRALHAEWPERGIWRVQVIKERPPVNGDADETSFTVEG
ncbi:MAG: dihydroneopterin aldolase [Flavobacteriales bacterium]|nr:dihydroneopterin aldolase [Flavobacteriales bacterium]